MFNWKKEEIAQNAIYLDKEMGGKGRQFMSRFLVPGLVKYDYGVCLLTKENADKFIQDFVGCPVIINHQDVTDENAKEISVGNIFSVWFDEKDGYYWCNGIITDKDAIKLIDKGYSVSCQYTITEYSDNNSGALHNGNPYDKIIENGRPEHLAIVNNPRYEGAIIAVNAIMAENANGDDEKGEWITVKGTHIFVPDGKSKDEVIKEKFGKKEEKETYYEDDMEESYTQDYADSIKKDFEEFMKAQKEKKEDKKEQTLDDKIKEHENKIPKNYKRDIKTKALWLYKNSYITRTEFENVQKASNSFVEEFKDTLYSVLAEGIANRLGELIASNKNQKEKWVTIKGNHILLKEGESIADAFKRTTGVSLQKSNNPQEHKQEKYKSILKQLEQDNQKVITPDEIIEKAVSNKNLKDENGNLYTAEAIREKVKKAKEYNFDIAKNNRQTFEYYSDGKGHYDKNRIGLHKKILNDIFMHEKDARPKDGAKPKFIMLGGRGGSGKSKFGEDGVAKVYDKKNYIVLDADEIKKSLPEYKGYNAFEVHEESSDILKKAMKIARLKGLNVVLDGTMSGFKSTKKKLDAFKKSDYDIEMYYMHLPREKSTERAIGRFMKKGGRFVPLDVLLDMKDNEANFDKLKSYASKWAFYNNDVERGQEPKLIDKSN